MGINLILTANANPVTVSGGGGGPTYTPVFKFSGAGQSVGSAASWPFPTAYFANDIAGPFGATTVKQSLTYNSNGFGGWMVPEGTFNWTAGTNVWIRIYQYFPTSFCFSYLPGTDGWGGTKWIRMQSGSGSGSGRATVELGSATPLYDSSYAFQVYPTCGTTTALYGDINEMGGGNQPFPNYTAKAIPRGVWHAIQTHWYLHPTNGWIRGWVDDTYLGQTDNHTTVPSGSFIGAVVLGDYWNGAIPKAQDWYFDEIIISTETPNTTDSGGRPYISPTTKVSDFP